MICITRVFYSRGQVEAWLCLNRPVILNHYMAGFDETRPLENDTFVYFDEDYRLFL